MPLTTQRLHWYPLFMSEYPIIISNKLLMLISNLIIVNQLGAEPSKRKRGKPERDAIPTSVSEIVSLVNRQKASVLYYR